MSRAVETLAAQLPALEAERARRRAYKFARYFPDCLPGCDAHSRDVDRHVIRPGDFTPVCRVLYRRHLQFFDAGARHRQRLFLKANRVGGTEAGAYELTCHLTGRYPAWWTGRRFSEAGEWWVAGDTADTTRDILQLALWGPLDAPRTGMIPAHLITHHTKRGGERLEMVWVRHVTGKAASIQFKSYDQGRRTFQGTAKQGIWLDEEAPSEIVAECLLRLMTTNGLLLLTFTPLNGLTPFITEYLAEALLETDSGLIEAKSGVFGDNPVA